MSNRKTNKRDSFWLLALGLLTVQVAIILAYLKRLFDRSESQPSPSASQPHSIQPDRLPARLPSRVSKPTGTSRRPFVPIRPQRIPRKRKGDINWDVLGFASAAVTLISGAIFYISGWIYEAHWHSYYGIHISQVELSPSQVMVQGIPGILFFAAAILCSLVLISISKKTSDGTIQDFVFVIVFAYMLATAFLWYLLTSSSSDGSVWWFNLREVQLALFPSALIVFSIIVRLVRDELFRTLDNIGAALFQKAMMMLEEPDLAEREILTFRKKLVQAITERLQRMIQVFLERPFSSSAFLVNRIIIEIIRVVTAPIWQLVHRALFLRFGVALQRTWHLGLSLSMLFLFLLSIAVSALMGEYDARRGVRSLDGHWQLSKVLLSSDVRIELLHTPESTPMSTPQNTPTPTPQDAQLEVGFEYGSLGLIASNENTFFLVDWAGWNKDKKYFEHRPNLYLVSRDSKSNVQLFIPAPTLTPAPTHTPTPTFTPTPTPLSTPTPSP